MLGHDIFFGVGGTSSANGSISNITDTKQHAFSWSDSSIAGVWQHGFELFYLKQLDISSVIRPNFFKTLDLLLNADFNIVLYTRSVFEFTCHLRIYVPKHAEVSRSTVPLCTPHSQGCI